MSLTSEQLQILQDARKAARILGKACGAAEKVDADVLRAMLHNWRSVDSVTLAAPSSVAEQLLRALDVIAVLQERETYASQSDELMAKAFGAEARRPVIKLQYFKTTGKWYSSGEYETDKPYFHEVIKEVRQFIIDGKLPDLVDGAREFHVLLEAGEPWGVPHFFPVGSV